MKNAKNEVTVRIKSIKGRDNREVKREGRKGSEKERKSK